MFDHGVRGNYTPEENMHLTLAFIGDYPEPQAVMDALSGVEFAPFDLALDGIGSFGDLWWAGWKRWYAGSAGPLPNMIFLLTESAFLRTSR